MEMVSLDQNKPMGGARKKESKSGGGNNTGSRKQPVKEIRMGLPTDVRTDAVPATPDVSPANPLLSALPQLCDQSTKNRTQKSVEDDIHDTISSHIQKTLNMSFDNNVAVSSGEWIASSSSMASGSSSKGDKSFSDMSSVEEEDIPVSDMPIQVSFECYDVLLLHSDEEIREATNVKTHLETNFWLNEKSEKSERISVLLYDDLSRMIGRKVSCLQEGMEHCTFIFILVTRKFCECELSRFLSEECLIQSIQDPCKKWSVVPLFTESKRKASYVIPSGLNCLKGVNYFSQDEFYKANMTKMVEAKLYIKHGRQSKRLQVIQDWKDNKRHEMRMENIKREHEKKELEERRKLELEELHRWDKRKDKDLSIEPSHMPKSSSSGDLPFVMTGQPGMYQPVPCKNPITGQIEHLPWYAWYQHQQVMAHPQNFPMVNPNLSPYQGGQYGYSQPFGIMPHSYSVPTSMHGTCNLYQAQTKGDLGTSLSQGPQQETVQPNTKDSTRKPTVSHQPEPIENVDKSLKSVSLDDEGSAGAQMAKCTDPAGMKVTSKRVREGRYGSGNDDDCTAKGGTQPVMESFDSVSYIRQGLGNTSPGVNLDCDVEEDVSRFTEETLLKEHCSDPYNSCANSQMFTDSGIGSGSLGPSTGVTMTMKHGTGDYTGDPALVHPGSFNTTFSGPSLKGNTAPSQTVVREIHHHHHHETEGKKVIIIQNCPSVNIGDTTTVSHVKHEEPRHLTARDDFRGDESYGDGDYYERSDIDQSNIHVPLDSESDQYNLRSDDNDTEVKFSTNNYLLQSEPLYNSDEETSLKTAANLSYNSNQNNTSAADSVLSCDLSAIGHGECGEARNTASRVDMQQSHEQGVSNPLQAQTFSAFPVEGNNYSLHETVKSGTARNSAKVVENKNTGISDDKPVEMLKGLKSAKPAMECPTKRSEATTFKQGQTKNITADMPDADVLVEESFVVVTSSSETGEVLEELEDSSGPSAATVPHRPLLTGHSSDDGSSVDPQQDLSASMPKEINISQKRPRKDKKDCRIA